MDQSLQAIASDPPVPTMPSTAHFDKWQISVLDYYKSSAPHPNVYAPHPNIDAPHPSIDQVFCPIIGLYFHFSDMAVVRIVPSANESRHIAYQFGDLDDVEADKRIIEGPGNGLVMYRGIADKFFNGELMIIPVLETNPHELHVILLNEIIGSCRIPGFQSRYSILDLKLLEFKNDCRPDLRCLHWRYIISLERATNRSWLQVERTPKWGFPGRFMRKGVIRHMDLSVGRRGIPNEIVFADTIWDGVEPGDAGFDREIAGALERSARGNRSESETSLSRSGHPQYTAGTNAASAMNQGPNASGSGVPTSGMQAPNAASGVMPGTIGPVGTMPEAA